MNARNLFYPLSALILCAAANRVESPTAPLDFNPVYEFSLCRTDYNRMEEIPRSQMDIYFHDKAVYDSARSRKHNGLLIVMTEDGDKVLLKISERSAQRWMQELEKYQNDFYKAMMPNTYKIIGQLQTEYQGQRLKLIAEQYPARIYASTPQFSQ